MKVSNVLTCVTDCSPEKCLSVPCGQVFGVLGTEHARLPSTPRTLQLPPVELNRHRGISPSLNQFHVPGHEHTEVLDICLGLAPHQMGPGQAASFTPSFSPTGLSECWGGSGREEAEEFWDSVRT